MEIYKNVMGYLSRFLPVEDWPDMKIVLEQAISKKPKDWLLPVKACESIGGKCDQAIPAVAAIACMQISIILIDDLLDDDPRGMFNQVGEAATANLAIAFHAAGLEAIAYSNAKLDIKLASLNSLNNMMLTTALGQHLDVQNPEDEAAYWRLVRTKSSPFFGTALYVGALLGGAQAGAADRIRELGCIYGEIIQLHDDLNDTMAIPANPDWTLGRSPLPILYAQIVEHPDKVHFRELRQAIPDPKALVEAQSILIRCGAISFAVDQILCRYQAARKILESIQLIHRTELEGLLEDVVDPVRKIFEFVEDASQSQTSLCSSA